MNHISSSKPVPIPASGRPYEIIVFRGKYYAAGSEGVFELTADGAKPITFAGQGNGGH